MKDKLNDTNPQTKRTLIEAFIYKIYINENDINIMLYLDSFINKNCDNIGGGEGNRTPVQKPSHMKLLQLILSNKFN